eukprot:3459492-Alexandrium_andersonii.AAC.1
MSAFFGEPCREDGYEVGELVYYRVRPTGSERSLDARRESGVWLGRRWGAGAHVVAINPHEACEARAVARRPVHERWPWETLERPRVLPWAWRAAPLDGGGDPPM